MPALPLLLDPARRPVIAHRGASARAPENTLLALEFGLADGAEALEFDVRATADGVAVVLHDATLDRTTDRTGPVAALSLARLRAADAGARFSPDGRSFPFRDQGLRVPTVDEVLDRFPDTPLLIEIKTASAQEALRAAILAHGAAERCLVMSADPLALGAFRAAGWHTGAAAPEAQRLLLNALFRAPMGAVAYQAFSIPFRWGRAPLPMGLLARAARRVGRPLHVWTVDEPERAVAYWRMGISGIVTNTPAAIRAARDTLG